MYIYPALWDVTPVSPIGEQMGVRPRFTIPHPNKQRQTTGCNARGAGSGGSVETNQRNSEPTVGARRSLHRVTFTMRTPGELIRGAELPGAGLPRSRCPGQGRLRGGDRSDPTAGQPDTGARLLAFHSCPAQLRRGRAGPGRAGRGGDRKSVV